MAIRFIPVEEIPLVIVVKDAPAFVESLNTDPPAYTVFGSQTKFA
jgi:hypothetical protein